MAQRVLAVIGAVAFVLAAVVVRNAIDDGGDEDGPARDDELIVACDRDLEQYCRFLQERGDVTGLLVEESATTALGLVGGTLQEADAWITSDVWFDVAEGRAQGSLGEPELLATSPVVLAVDPQRTAAVSELCAGKAVWRCVGDNAGQVWSSIGGDATWGRLNAGLPDADAATGLSVLAAVAMGYFEGPDFAANDFRNGFDTWLSGLADPGGDPDPAATLVARRGEYSVAGAVGARVDQITRPVDQLDATPTFAAGVVLVDLAGGDDVGPLAGAARGALTDLGWTAASGPPTLPFLPGVMAALHTLWTEVT